MKSILLFFASLFTLNAWSQKTDTLTLVSAENEEAILYVYHPAQKNQITTAVLICPGGGYSGLAIDREGYDMAKWYASNGITAGVLKYRMPKGRNTVPLSDAEKAISYIRAHAEEWGIDSQKVGVIGSSAGGHLAASLSTLAADQNRPNFAILYYPVISLEDDLAHKGSKKNLLGDKQEDKDMVLHYSLQYQVDEKTPKTLILLSEDDRIVPPMNSIVYYQALNKQKIPSSLYMFPYGGHGWGIKYDFSYYQEVKDLITKWMKQNKLID